MTVSRFTDRDPDDPWRTLRLHRATAADPRVILVRAICGCGWYQSGDPAEVLGASSEHFRGHWNVAGQLPGLSIEEDTGAEAEVRSLQEASTHRGRAEDG